MKEPIKYAFNKHGRLVPKDEVLKYEAAENAAPKPDKKQEKSEELKAPNSEKKTLKLPEKD